MKLIEVLEGCASGAGRVVAFLPVDFVVTVDFDSFPVVGFESDDVEDGFGVLDHDGRGGPFVDVG